MNGSNFDINSDKLVVISGLRDRWGYNVHTIIYIEWILVKEDTSHTLLS